MTGELIRVSQNIEKIRKLMVQVANSEGNAIVVRETGVGKEIIVQNIYRASARNGKPFCKSQLFCTAPLWEKMVLWNCRLRLFNL